MDTAPVPMAPSADPLPADLTEERLRSEPNVWLATTRPDGRPHLSPIWFVWVDCRFWICTMADSVKTANVGANPRVSVALESGSAPVVVEGLVVIGHPPFDLAVRGEFIRKYDWDVDGDAEYTAMLEITPVKWLMGTAPRLPPRLPTGGRD